MWYAKFPFEFKLHINANNLMSASGPLDLVGHSAVVVSEKGNKSRHSRMVVISGHSPRYSYVNVVQEFHFGMHLYDVGYFPHGNVYSMRLICFNCRKRKLERSYH